MLIYKHHPHNNLVFRGNNGSRNSMYKDSVFQWFQYFLLYRLNEVSYFQYIHIGHYYQKRLYRIRIH